MIFIGTKRTGRAYTRRGISVRRISPLNPNGLKITISVTSVPVYLIEYSNQLNYITKRSISYPNLIDDYIFTTRKLQEGFIY